MQIKTVKQHIKENHNGNQSACARANGVARTQVKRWIEKEYFVIDGKLCAVLRDIK